MSINLARENQELSKEEVNNYLHVYMWSMYVMFWSLILRIQPNYVREHFYFYKKSNINNKESGHGYIINIKVTITVVRVYHH